MKTYRGILTSFILLWEFLYAFNAWHKLPASIANDYDAAGIAHKHASHIFLWIIPLISLGMVLLLTAIRRNPNTFNLPAARNAPDRPRQTAIALELLSWMRLEITLLFACLLYSFASVGLYRHATPYPTAVAAVILLATLILHLYRMRSPQSPQPARFQ